MNIDKMIFAKATQIAARQGAIQVYPNPSKGVFAIEQAPASGTITVANNFGRSVFQEDLAKFNGTIDISAQPAGFVHCYDIAVRVSDTPYRCRNNSKRQRSTLHMHRRSVVKMSPDSVDMLVCYYLPKSS